MPNKKEETVILHIEHHIPQFDKTVKGDPW